MKRPTPPPAHAIETWVFDLDNTLYDARCDLFSQIDVRMGQFIQNLLGLSATDAKALQKQYFRDHGTTLRGLMTHQDIDPRTYLDFVHDIDYAPVPPSPNLNTALTALPGRKIIFTNADVPHAERVLDRLGVAHHFDTIYDIEAANYAPKPTPEIYDDLIAETGIDPARAAMVEDMARNLKPAADRGMTTLWVETDTRWGREGGDAPHVHYATRDLIGWLSAVAKGGFPPASG